MTRIIAVGLAWAAFAGIGGIALGLGGCQSITPQQVAVYTQAFCVLSADGAVLAVATTKGGAQATAQKIAAAQPVACDAATVVGQIVAK